jgi:hypothetical protein
MAPRHEVDSQCYFHWDEGQVEVWVRLDDRWQHAVYPFDLDELLHLGRAGYEQALVHRFITERRRGISDEAA